MPIFKNLHTKFYPVIVAAAQPSTKHEQSLCSTIHSFAEQRITNDNHFILLRIVTNNNRIWHFEMSSPCIMYVQYIGGWVSIHQVVGAFTTSGGMFNTLGGGGVQYIGGIL